MLWMIPVLHSVSYAGVWPGQASLTLPQFLDKAVELGFPAVMLMAKRPHLSPLDFDAATRDTGFGTRSNGAACACK
jgi:hypothetical protein